MNVNRVRRSINKAPCINKATPAARAAGVAPVRPRCPPVLLVSQNGLGAVERTKRPSQMAWQRLGFWRVRIAAYQALGPFISTFANPMRTGLYCSEDGVVSVQTPEDQFDAFIEGEAPSTSDNPALLTAFEKPAPLKDTRTSDLPLTGTVGDPDRDLASFEV
ncbi:hypothetical protein HPB51_016747 [Rhipicephalus microplus]|uniref:Uncharacterized protein n=1 Tax=Rhipicephalus microplus TaxID=6941 RepID=A0A9J6DA89_RHIMP|nr:hypothetical protein HPB51_016747 [Rhipicephalus microplus]